MPATNWINPNNIDPEQEREYIALVTYLPLTGYFKFPSFFKYVSRIQVQLRTAPGLIGYKLRADILTKKTYTVSVWEDRDSLFSFVGSGAHKKTMAEIPGYLGKDRKFVEVKIKGREIPPGWDWVFQVLSEN
jgi:quinol monooxygenase YgiN